MIWQILCTIREPSEIQGHVLHTFNFKSNVEIVGSVESPTGPDEGWVASRIGSEMVSIAFSTD